MCTSVSLLVLMDGFGGFGCFGEVGMDLPGGSTEHV